MEISFISVFLVSGLLTLIVCYFIYKGKGKGNWLLFLRWLIIGGLCGGFSMYWWAAEVFIVDNKHNSEGSNKTYFIGHYKKHRVSLFHKYVDNLQSDTLVAYAIDYWENDDELEYTIIMPNEFTIVGGSIDYYHVPPPKSIHITSIPFYHPHITKWALSTYQAFVHHMEHPDDIIYQWDE